MSDTILRAGVIGATGRGNYGHGLGDAFTALERTPVVAVADADPAGGAEAAGRFGTDNHYLDYRDMLARERLDVVAVSPRWTDQRRDMVVAAAQAGVKGIFCEKPFAATLADADAMMEACDRHGVRVVVAHRRAASHEQRLKQIVDSGEIGEIQVMRGHGKGDHRAGSLDLMILGTHILDGIRYVADSDVAWAHGHVTQDGRPVTRDDVKEGDEGVGLLAGNRVAAYYVFENGLTAHYESFQGFPDDANDHNRHLGFEVYGTKGIVSVRNSPGGELYLHRRDLWIPDTDTRPWERIRIPEWERQNSGLASNLIIVTRDARGDRRRSRHPGGLLRRRFARHAGDDHGRARIQPPRYAGALPARQPRQPLRHLACGGMTARRTLPMPGASCRGLTRRLPAAYRWSNFANDEGRSVSLRARPFESTSNPAHRVARCARPRAPENQVKSGPAVGLFLPDAGQCRPGSFLGSKTQRFAR